MEKKTKILKFVPFVSCIEPGFWYKLRDLKLNELALNESSHSIKVYYNNSQLTIFIIIFSFPLLIFIISLF